MNSKKLQEVYLGVVQNVNNEILIIHRVKEEKGTGKTVLSWAFPGGVKNFEDETMNEVLIRELLEETGYKIMPGKIISEREHPNFPVYVYYVGCSLEMQVPIQSPSDPEVENAKWIKPNEILNYFTSDLDPKVKRALEKLSQN